MTENITKRLHHSPAELDADYASLCMLSYERPDFLNTSLDSISEDKTYPYEFIIHDDGSTEIEERRILDDALMAGEISTLITNPPDHNQGQGIALNRMFGAAKGDPLIKLDADLTYRVGWLRETCRLFRQHPDIGLIGLLHYHHEPVDSRETVIERHDDYSIHTHILGSGFAVRRQCWEELGPFEEHSDAFAEDWSFQVKVTESEKWKCALPKDSLVANHGMGVATSTVVVDHGVVAKIHKTPHIINNHLISG